MKNSDKSIGWPKWLKSLGTAGTSAFPILFTKLFWKMAKKFKNFGVLGCLIAVEEMADFTLWFQQKYDFFGTSSVLTPLVALKTQPNLWKQLFLCQCTSQGPKITKSELLEGFKHFEWQWSTGQWGEKVSFCQFFYFPPILWLQIQTQMCANLQTYNKTQEWSQNVTRNTTYSHFDQSLAETANSQFFTPIALFDDCHPKC